MFVLVSFVSALSSDKVISLYDFENNYYDLANRNNLIGSGSIQYATGVINTYSGNWTPNNFLFNNSPIGFSSGTYSFSINNWVNFKVLPAGSQVQQMGCFGDGSAYANSFYWALYNNNSGYLFANQRKTDLGNSYLLPISTGVWYMATFVYNSSDGASGTDYYYLNATKINEYPHKASEPYNIHPDKIKIGNLCHSDGSYANSLMDYFLYYNDTLNQADINNLYSGCEYPFTACGTPTITIKAGLSNNTINYNTPSLAVSYNFTIGVDNTANTTNCTLLVNSAINDTQLDRNISTNYNFNISLIDEIIDNMSIEIQCNNFEVNGSSGIYYYSIDTVNPIISSTEINTTQYVVGDILSYTYNCSDVNLFALNDSIFNPNNVVVSNRFTENITTTTIENSTSYTFTSAGNYTTVKTCFDSHTGKKVNPLNWKVYNNYTLLLADDLYIWDDDLKTKNHFNNTITYLYLSDNQEKYKFKLTWDSTSTYHTLKINTSSVLIPVTNRGYKGHFVYNYQRAIDFEENNIKDVIITLNDGYYLLEIYLYNASDEIETESVYDLNVVTQVRYYTVISEVAESNQILTDINKTLSNLNNTLLESRGDSSMLWLSVLVALFFIVGIVLRNTVIWNLSGMFLLVMGFNAVQLAQTNDNLFNYGISILFWIFGLVIMFTGTTIYIISRVRKKNKAIDDFYTIY